VYTSIDGKHPIDVSAPINPYNGRGNAFQGYNSMQLAWPKNDLKQVDRFYPAIAKSWDASPDGTQLTIHLRPDARWSDGTPVTAEDIRTSVAVAFTQGGSAFSVTPGASGVVGDVTVVDQRTVRFNQAPGSGSNTFVRAVLQLYVLPQAVYGPELPPDFWDLLRTAAAREPVQADAAEKARAQITALGKRLVAFGPRTDLSCGPFVLRSVSPGEALLVKNRYFPDAARIGPDRVKLRNYSDNQAIWNYLIAGDLDSAPYTATPTNVVRQILRTPGNQKITGRSQVSAALAFNQSYPPLDKPQVRQALAYLIDRRQVQTVGEPDSGTAAEYTTGLVADAAKVWLTGPELGRLDRYPVDRAKAERLLTEAGLSRSGGRWQLADGRPFTFTIGVPAPYSDWMAAAKNIASQLTDAGITVEVTTSADYAAYQAEMADGKYPAGFWLIGLGPSTYNAYARLYGAANGWSTFAGRLTHNAARSKGNWIGAPESAAVPGVGTVSPGQLTYQLSQQPLDRQHTTVAQLARFTNDQLPMIQLWDYVNVQFTNDSRFTGFPPDNCECLGLTQGVWMQLGYIHKR
jgi:peptide/nickel transport system substrate-binding protein